MFTLFLLKETARLVSRLWTNLAAIVQHCTDLNTEKLRCQDGLRQISNRKQAVITGAHGLALLKQIFTQALQQHAVMSAMNSSHKHPDAKQ